MSIEGIINGLILCIMLFFAGWYATKEVRKNEREGKYMENSK